MSNDGYAGLADPQSAVGDFNRQSFLIASMIGRMATVALVKVVDVNAGAGTVNVQPMVAQIDGAGNGTPHGIIANLPYFRLQGGVSAVKLTPVVGDIGAALFCSRDISKVKATKAPALPGSRRAYDWADGLYIGGWLNGVPTELVEFLNPGIKLTSTTQVIIDAPAASTTGDFSVGGNLSVSGDADLQQDATIHGKVTAASGDIGGSGTQPVKLSDGSAATELKAK